MPVALLGYIFFGVWYDGMLGGATGRIYILSLPVDTCSPAAPCINGKFHTGFHRSEAIDNCVKARKLILNFVPTVPNLIPHRKDQDEQSSIQGKAQSYAP